MLFKTLRIYAATITLCVTMAGCSSTQHATKADTESAPALTQEQIKQLVQLLEQSEKNRDMLESWQTRQDGLERLLAIETDLRTLIEQLSFYVEQEQPTAQPEAVPEPQQQTRSEIARTAPNAVPPAEQTENSAPSPVYTLQLAAMTDRKKLDITWRQLTQKEADLLAPLTPFYEPTNNNGTQYYRLKAGAFKEKQQALALCNALKQNGVSCLVSRHSRETSNLNDANIQAAVNRDSRQRNKE